MAKRKKKNNIVLQGESYYCRVRFYNDNGRQVERKIHLHTKKKDEAISRAKIVLKEIENIKDGTIQRFQFDEYFAFSNDKGTSKLIAKSLESTISDYISYRINLVRTSTLKRDKVALNQLRRFLGSNKAVETISYQDVEGCNGLIKHLRNKGCSDVGINTSLRHIKTFFNWLFEKEKVIPEPIKFNLIPKGIQLYHFFNEKETNQIFKYIDDSGIDSFYKRCFHFYNETGMRPSEPFIGELVGDWYVIEAEQRKNRMPMQMELTEELKTILLEMQSYRDTKLHCVDANVRVCDEFSRMLKKIIIGLGFTGKRLSLYSFRHSYAIRRVTMTNVNIHQVMMEMGHTNTQTTISYLRFPQQRRLDDFPSLRDYVENIPKFEKNSIRGTKIRGTIYNNLSKL